MTPRWLVALVPLAACTPLLGGAGTEAPGRAWVRYLEGETADAEASLASMSADDHAKFILANIFLADGRGDRAASLAAELRQRHPDEPELRLLDGLIARRHEHPDEAWLDSFVETWGEAGRPMLRPAYQRGGWVPFPDIPVPAASVRAVAGTPLQLLVEPTICAGDHCADHADNLVREPLSPDLRVLALRCATSCPRSTDDARRSELAERLTSDFPDAAEFGLRAIVAALPRDEALSDTVLDRLGRLLSRPLFRVPRGQLYEAYKQHLRAIGLPQPELRAIMMTNFVEDLLTVGLLRTPLLRTVRDGAAHASWRAATLSTEVARALLRDRRVISWVQAVPFAFVSGEAGDVAAQDCAESLRAFVPKLFPNTQSAALAATYWPIAALEREAADAASVDEVGLYARLAGMEVPPAIENFAASQDLLRDGANPTAGRGFHRRGARARGGRARRSHRARPGAVRR